jgi:hypothetical protein
MLMKKYSFVNLFKTSHYTLPDFDGRSIVYNISLTGCDTGKIPSVKGPYSRQEINRRIGILCCKKIIKNTRNDHHHINTAENTV